MNTAYIIIATFLIAIIIYRRLTYSAGGEGERSVAWRLRWLPKDRYFVINDLMIEKRNGNTSQIDHVVVSPYGIFVIETKNISGYVYGAEYSQQWKRYWKGYKRGGRYGEDELMFDNPVLQNGSHVKALMEQLQDYYPRYIPIVAFSPQATLKVDVRGVDVIYWTELRSVIKSYKEEVMSVEKAQEIYQLLLSLNIKDKARRQEHVERAERNKRYYKYKN